MIKIIPDIMISDLTVSCKKQALYAMAEKVAEKFGCRADNLIHSLLEREEIGSTGIGQGVAIPHAQMPDIDRFIGVFAQLEKPIDFDAFDDKEVDLIYLLLVPEGIKDGSHLQALAKISRFFRSPELCQKLRAEKDGSQADILLGMKSA